MSEKHTHTHVYIFYHRSRSNPRTTPIRIRQKQRRRWWRRRVEWLSHRKNIIYRSTIPRSCACARSPAKRECTYILSSSVYVTRTYIIRVCAVVGGEDDSDDREMSWSIEGDDEEKGEDDVDDDNDGVRAGSTTTRTAEERVKKIYVRYIICYYYIIIYVMCGRGWAPPRNSKSLINHQRMWHEYTTRWRRRRQSLYIHYYYIITS